MAGVPEPPSISADNQAEPTWIPTLAVLGALILQLALPANLVLGPQWLLPALEAILLAPILVGARRRHHREAMWARLTSITLIALINLANVVSLGLLAYYLVHGGKAGGQQLIVASIGI
ncbi:MAG TPA: hypothetical protein VG015_06155, partial [Candidatus Dormibacteraeota bacterium]|nr:hypothetical protein [Candidatus Dormibacteraeota bacterium]